MGSINGFEGVLFDFAAIFVGAAAAASVFLYARQPIILAYIAVGALLGPAGLRVVHEPAQIRQMSQIGVFLLLFLVGLDLQPMKLLGLFRQSSLLTLGSSAVFGVVSALFGLAVGLPAADAGLFGTAMMFSSTVIGLKLVPTTTLHQRRAGERMTSVLILQDILAILAILMIGGERSGGPLPFFVPLVGKFGLFCLLAFIGVRRVVFPLFKRFDVIQEFMFVVTLAWCLLCAETARMLGLSHEMGAFIGGLAMGSHRVALVIADTLKPLREFFLILFFFAVGAGLDFHLSPRLILAGLLFGCALVYLKFLVYRQAFRWTGESAALSAQLGVRLGQASEFSLLVAFAGVATGVLSRHGELLIQVTTIATFVVSTYWTVRKYPTPISPEEPLRQD